MTELDVWGHLAPEDRVVVAVAEDDTCEAVPGDRGTIKGAEDGLLLVQLDDGRTAAFWRYEIELVEDECE